MKKFLRIAIAEVVIAVAIIAGVLIFTGDRSGKTIPSESENPVIGSSDESGSETESESESESESETEPSGSESEPKTDIVKNGYTVCIDAGHQKAGIPELEPNGPGSSVMKVKLTTGTVGTTTHVAEHTVNLQVALKLKEELLNRGYGVVMIRETDDCPMSNAERAVFANESGADIFIRIHCNGSNDPTIDGVVLYSPSLANPYIKPAGIISNSYYLSSQVEKEICKATGAKNRGIIYGDDMTGINWCQIPVSIIEMGFMSNPDEDRKLVSEEYQTLLAIGMANGIDAYFQ